MLEFDFSSFPELSTERLRLRKITVDDAEPIFKLRTDPQVTLYSDRFPPDSMDEIYSFLKIIENGISSNESIAWAIQKKEDPAFIGTINFHRIYREHHRAEMGYQLLPEYWRKGIMSEAMRAVIDHGFRKMNLHSIEAQVNPNNKASIQLLLKHGFVQEALFKENYYFDGKFLDTPVFSLLNKEN